MSRREVRFVKAPSMEKQAVFLALAAAMPKRLFSQCFCSCGWDGPYHIEKARLVRKVAVTNLTINQASAKPTQNLIKTMVSAFPKTLQLIRKNTFNSKPL